MNIEFIPKSNDVSQILSPPKPSKFYMPDWFKDMPPTLPSFDTGKMDGTAKKCMPFLDSLTSGYTQELICDVSIKNHGTDKQTGYDIISYKYAGDIRPLSTRLENTKSRHVFPNFEGYYDTEFHWDTLWEPKTPPGYSTFYYHPANRFDLPFQTMNGIIDTDKWFMSGPLPFLIKKGFEGIIPAGTPIYQMIFIKRDSWNSSSMEYDESFNKKKEYSVRKFFKDGYKKTTLVKEGILMKDILLSTLTGFGCGAIFAAFKLPVPAPPVFAGLAGIIGIWLGATILTNIIS